MAGRNVHTMDAGAPALATDEIYATRDPYEIGDDVKLTLADVADFVKDRTTVRGTLALGNGVSEGSVTGLDLESGAPEAVILTLQIPAGGGVMTSVLVGAPTSDGFDFALSGMTDSTNYVLHYLIFL